MVRLSVYLSVMTVSPAKAAESIVMPFGIFVSGGPKEPFTHLHMGVRIPTHKWEILRAKRGRHRPCPDMSGRHTQSDSAGGRTATVRMPTGVYQMVCTLTPPGEYD